MTDRSAGQKLLTYEEYAAALEELLRWAIFCSWLEHRPLDSARPSHIPSQYQPLVANSPEARARREELGFVQYVPPLGWRLNSRWRKRLDEHIPSKDRVARAARPAPPRIELHCEVERGTQFGQYLGRAVTEDGEFLASVLTDAPRHVQAELTTSELLAEYGRRYPDGFELIWVSTGEVFAAQCVDGVWRLKEAVSGEA